MKPMTPAQWRKYAMLNLDPKAMEFIDDVEVALADCELEEPPLEHLFTEGLYTRTIKMRAGLMITTRIHLKEHPFVVSQGSVSVWTPEGTVHIKAPYIGVTKPGTRRILYIHEDTIWSTFHVTNEKDVDKIVKEVTLDYRNPRLEKKLNERGIKPLNFQPVS